MTRFCKFGPAAAAALMCLYASGAHAAFEPFTVGGTSGGSALTLLASAAATSTTTTTTTTTPSTALTSVVPVGQTQGQVATDFLTQTLTPASTGGTPAASEAASELQVYVQSASALRNPLSVNLRSGSDLALWNLVATIQAQQFGSPFDLVDTGVTAFQLLALDTDISAVPLPASAWLFVMGLLGLAGTRLTGQSSAGSRQRAGDQGRDDASRHAGGGLGPAVAA